jgi:large subunit ribosomal protein L17
MFRNMVTSLLKHERIRTTDAKAKELRRWADHVITLAKKGDLHARRSALAIVREKDVVHKLFETAGDRFGAISGGYTRIVKIGPRPGDAAPMSVIELVGPGAAPKKRKKKAPKVAAVETPAVAAGAVDSTAPEAAPENAPDSEAAAPGGTEPAAAAVEETAAVETAAEAAAEPVPEAPAENADAPETEPKKE